ncbi:hypothetical protein HYU15_02825 [Candidatus Woesearchaeota archaeon]|nr:hypothetical protein [Candidatus Woesearchaeota archaeon]
MIDSDTLLNNYYFAYTNVVYPAARYKPGRVAFGLPRDYPVAIEFFQMLLEDEPQWAGSYSTLTIEARIRYVETQEIVRPQKYVPW